MRENQTKRNNAPDPVDGIIDQAISAPRAPAHVSAAILAKLPGERGQTVWALGRPFGVIAPALACALLFAAAGYLSAGLLVDPYGTSSSEYITMFDGDAVLVGVEAL